VNRNMAHDIEAARGNGQPHTESRHSTHSGYQSEGVESTLPPLVSLALGSALGNTVPPVPGTRCIPLREDFLGLCNRDIDAERWADPYCRAMALQQFVFLYDARLEGVRQAIEVNEAAARAGVEPGQDTSPWFYISQEQMRVDLLEQFGELTIVEAYAWLLKQGWIAWRTHPAYPNDQSRQWIVKVRELRAALACWALTDGHGGEA
jgi:hypothetical protein